MTQKHIDVLTCFPQDFEHLVSFGLLGQALKKKIWSLTVQNLRDFGLGLHRSLDKPPFGGSDGMILTPSVLEPALEFVRQNSCKASSLESSLISSKAPLYLYPSPQGAPLTQKKVYDLATRYDHYIILCGRYSGVDQRILNHYNFVEVSLGDYILSGGELATAVLIDAMARYWPGVLGNPSSAVSDSFSQDPPMLEAPLLTRPRLWQDYPVPEILLSGHHEQIHQWTQKISYLVTYQKRPDLVDLSLLSTQDLTHLQNFTLTLSPQDLKTLGIKKETLLSIQNYQKKDCNKT
jgi:tRNA (guanine37-N1)-methyltransferase